MASALEQEKLYTINDIYNLPEGSRAELINGQIYYMAPPTRKHQRILGEIFAAIHEYINTHNGSCEVDIAPFAVFLDKDDKNYVEPDISVICNPDKLTEKGCFGAPDWIIEIVSSGSRRMDYFIKLFNTALPAFVNTGLSILTGSASPCMILNPRISRTILFLILQRSISMMIYILTSPRLQSC